METILGAWATLSSRLRLFTCQKRWRGHVNTIDLLPIEFDQRWTQELRFLIRGPNIATLTSHNAFTRTATVALIAASSPSLTNKRYEHQASRTATSRGTTIPATSQNPTSSTKDKTLTGSVSSQTQNPPQQAHLPATTDSPKQGNAVKHKVQVRHKYESKGVPKKYRNSSVPRTRAGFQALLGERRRTLTIVPLPLILLPSS